MSLWQDIFKNELDLPKPWPPPEFPCFYSPFLCKKAYQLHKNILRHVSRKNSTSKILEYAVREYAV
jgi:hypothetical protein